MQTLTNEQQDKICYLIDEWYFHVFHIKDNLVYHKSETNNLRAAKEILKTMIFEDIGFNEAYAKTINKMRKIPTEQEPDPKAEEPLYFCKHCGGKYHQEKMIKFVADDYTLPSHPLINIIMDICIDCYNKRYNYKLVEKGK